MYGVTLLSRALVIVLSVSSYHALASTVSNEFEQNVKDAKVFTSVDTEFDKYELILGKLEYQYPSSFDQVEGFRPSSSRAFEGKVSRSVFDLDSSVGTLKAIGVMESIMGRNGFDILFSCENLACGAIKGWGVYFPEQADGTKADQYYISGVYPKEGPPESLVSAHITKVGGRARVSIDEVDLLIDLDRSIDNYAISILDYWSENGYDRGLSVSGYKLGSSVLTEDMKLKYRAIAAIVDKNSGMSLRLSGYTDYIGEEESNKKLSLNRVEKAVDFLSGIGVPDDMMVYEGVGPIYDKTSNEVDVVGVPRHRKVFVVPSIDSEIGALN